MKSVRSSAGTETLKEKKAFIGISAFALLITIRPEKAFFVSGINSYSLCTGLAQWIGHAVQYVSHRDTERIVYFGNRRNIIDIVFEKEKSKRYEQRSD